MTKTSSTRFASELDFLYNLMEQRGWHDGVELLQKIVRAADADTKVAERLDHWLHNGSTLTLRDDLASPFYGDYERDLDFHNAWEGIDTAHAYLMGGVAA